MTAFAISVDTEEARNFASRSLGCRFLDWQERSSKAYAVARGLPEAGVWTVALADTVRLEMGTTITISAPDDALWGGPIVLEVFAP
jgi:hypothetical protein